jgi:uncharacterized protein with NAD-binding domain and iron-sulfur cluster
VSSGAPPTGPDRVKVAVLGGGCGGLAAAWGLSATPALRERFDVTVYQLGWQLGGKGASGRAPHATGAAGLGQRIEEHGLHIWFGFYQHAFRMLRSAYEESGLAVGEEWWRTAFDRCDSVCLYDERRDGTWARQTIRLPRRGGKDGGPPTGAQRPPLGRGIARTIRVLANGVVSELGDAGPRRGSQVAQDGTALAATVATLQGIADEIDRAECPFALGADGAVASTTRGRERVAGRPWRRLRHDAVDPMLERLAGQVRELRSQVAEHGASDRLRLWREVLELMSASLAGVVHDDVLVRGFGVLDDEDLREWLGRHGASAETLARSPVLRGLYDLTFAYREGDKERPSLAAGKGLQSLLLMINYEGSFMWRMRAGMGDVVFAPLYLSLRRRGVAFEFFSRVTRLQLMPGRPVVDRIGLVREGSVRGGADRYDPLQRIGDWWCWPSAPDQGQLDDLAPAPAELRRGVDFDEVVLAIPVGALEPICGELADADPRFGQMLRSAETVRTKALQVWLTRSIAELRDHGDGGRLDPPATAYAAPFDTYCDMSHLLAVEGYDGAEGPKGVAYFCAVLPETGTQAEAEDAVRAGAVRQLEREAAAIWPRAFQRGEFDWDVVFDPLGREGPERLEAQYLRANVAGTDRYVTTPAGSVHSRLDPERSGFDNVVLAGDWTRNGIDGGCVEAAIVSGERAAAAVVARASQHRSRPGPMNRYVEYGAMATAPGPLSCERARLYCFFLACERARVQQLCDTVFKAPTGGALRYRVPRVAPIVLTFGTIAGLRSLHPDHAGHGTADEPEAAIWVPVIAQRWMNGSYVDEHLAIFMPYIWVDDPIAFASGREVYGFAKTQGWMPRLGDPRAGGPQAVERSCPDPPAELGLDVYGVAEYGVGSEVSRRRLLTIRARGPRRGGPTSGAAQTHEGADLGSLVTHCISELDPEWRDRPAVTRSAQQPRRRLAGMSGHARVIAALLSEQAIRLAFLKQIRDAARGEFAALQQIVEARSTVTPESMRWRKLRGAYDLDVNPLASQPVLDELGLPPSQTITRAFVAEFGFRMEPGTIRWP